MLVSSPSSTSSQVCHALTAISLTVGSPLLGRPRLLAGLVATLHPPVHKTGVPFSGHYGVTFRGELIVSNSRDLECDLARALLARGMTGPVTIVDPDTGRVRIIVNIAKAARLTVQEGPHGPRFVRYRTVLNRPPSRESLGAGLTIAKGRKTA